ncbi:uncharacterized protein LOC132066597 [Lycium ferocissimum]|uniref:uncharacterized protein LOC132066597 n=1 Tax=Lycium ferocissimum TaxID=112874 RepID=UPI0028160B9C|nr:uncharacterized protein LOC132066597 [Lycium ferocissimum]
MEKHFARFFWGSSNDKRRYHWSSWENLCFPKEEGGVGIRNMTDICKSLDIKKWWRFRCQDSLWARFTKAKYCIRAHPVAKVWVSGNSHIWKTLTKIRSDAEPHMIWKIQNGHISFWWDNWTGYGAIATYCPDYVHSSRTRVRNFIIDNEWDLQSLGDIVPGWLLHHIASIKIGSQHKKDYLMWKLAADGVFSNKEAWNGIRTHRQKDLFVDMPVDCLCCSNAQPETIQHFFIESEPALFLYGDQKKFYIRRMQQEVIWYLKAAMDKAFPKFKMELPWHQLCEVVEKLKPRANITQVTWSMPPTGKIKVNTDGSYNNHGNRAGIGGIARDETGSMIFAFAIPVQGTSHNMIEAMAIRYAAQWIKNNGYRQSYIESDSLMIVEMLTNRTSNNLTIKDIIEETMDIGDQMEITFKHCYERG